MFQNRNDIDEHPDFDMFDMEDCHIIGDDGMMIVVTIWKFP
jgi:hypothetical protein